MYRGICEYSGIWILNHKTCPEPRKWSEKLKIDMLISQDLEVGITWCWYI